VGPTSITPPDWPHWLFVPRRRLPRWSPDRPDRLIFWSDKDGKWDLYAWDRALPAVRRVTDRPSGSPLGSPLSWAALSPSGETIWWFQDTGGDEFGRWMSEPHDGSAPATPVSLIPPGYPAGIVLAGTYAVISCLDERGSTIWLIPRDETPRAIRRSDSGVWVTGLSADGGLISLLHAEHGDYRHPAVRVISPDGRVIADRWDGPAALLDVGPWAPVGSPATLVLFREGKGWRAPSIWTPETDTIEDLEVPLPGETQHVSWYPDGSALLLIQEFRGRSTPYRLGLEERQLVALSSEIGTVAEAAVRPDKEVWVDWSSSTDPGGLYANDESIFQPLAPVSHGVVPYTEFDADGLHGFLARPTGRGPLPTILLLHGGPEDHDRDRYCPRVQAWVSQGYVVALVNYRGSTGYGAQWREANLPDLGFTELRDLARVRSWLVNAGISDGRAIGLAGHSWGGYLVLLGLGTQPDLWSLGIAEAPTADFTDAHSQEPPWLQGWDRSVFGGSPMNRSERYQRHSPITYIDRVRAPLLIVGGRRDPRAPQRQIQRYVDRLRTLGKAHQVLWHDGGHWCLVTKDLIHILDVEIAFAKRHVIGSSRTGQP
jgi:dienelactone hydrolase